MQKKTSTKLYQNKLNNALKELYTMIKCPSSNYTPASPVIQWWFNIHKSFNMLCCINKLRNKNNMSISSVQFSHSVMTDSLRPHESQHARPPCPSPTPGVHSDSRPSSQWCHPAISSSVIPFSSCPRSLPASESFPVSQLFTWGGQSTGVSASASVLPMSIQVWSPLG